MYWSMCCDASAARSRFAEATLGSTDATGPILQTLFDTPTFRVRQVRAGPF